MYDGMAGMGGEPNEMVFQPLPNVAIGVPVGLQKELCGVLRGLGYVNEVVKISHEGSYSGGGVPERHRHFCQQGGYYSLEGMRYGNENHEYRYWYCQKCGKLLVQRVY